MQKGFDKSKFLLDSSATIADTLEDLFERVSYLCQWGKEIGVELSSTLSNTHSCDAIKILSDFTFFLRMLHHVLREVERIYQKAQKAFEEVYHEYQ